MPPILQWLRYSWLPGLLLVLLCAHYLSWLDLHALLSAESSTGLLAIALFLGIFFKSSRVVFAAALLLLIYLGAAAADWLHGDLLSLCLALGAVNMALVSFSRDRSVVSVFGVLLLFVLLLQGAGVYLLQSCCGAPVLGFSLQIPLPGHRAEVSLAALMFGFGALLATIKLLTRPDFTGWGLLLCTLLLAAGSYFGLRLDIIAAAAALLLVALVLRNAYELAFRDELTGIPSRRAYSRHLLTLGRHFSIAVVDIDHFKKLNDRHGHQVGDQALRMVAGKIARFGGGRAFRYGGEEFVVVIPGRDRDSARNSLERMREEISAYPMRLRSSSRVRGNSDRARRRRGQGGGKTIKTTVSVGVASSDSGLKSPDEVMRAADRALYKAKRSGRNRVCAHN
ncbi:GGDEF domain-containing protein [Microbulbifer marinus]|uniref:diguanylate cyclase n=1 Tax=Microbulbifer marinus TaxID=658218 RepID=A0A1H3X3X6_9GAMM|nr:GGDEF domain-containing protein [Microbulbifer marinus]SDZ93324.1 diguanylate cyclase (GGDEF) domain-containing protein [Microbulbifer marinus]